MRLAVFTNQFPGKITTFFARDMRALIDAGCEIDVFAFYPFRRDLWQYVPDILDEEVLPRSRVHHVSLARSLASLRPWPIRKVRRFIKDAIAVTGSAERFGFGPLAKSLYVLPKTWAWNSQFSHAYDHVLAYWGNYAATSAYVFHRLTEEGVPFSLFLHAGMDLYENQVYLREKLMYADNVIVVCDFNRQFLQDLYPDLYPIIARRIYKHHLALDLSEFPYNPNRTSRQRILAVGTLAKYKGYDRLLHAAAELTRRGVEYELEIVGDGPERTALMGLAKTLGILGSVRFRGWLRPAEVRSAMEEATIFVHPSVGIGDAVPTVIKESMALGTPVIASNLAGIPELVDNGRCGVLVEPENAIAMADAAESLLKDEQLRRHYASQARSFVEATFDLSRNGAALAAVLRSSRRQAGVVAGNPR